MVSADIVGTAADVTRYYVTPSWVAKFYGVPKLQVYRAIKNGRLVAVRIRSAESDKWRGKGMLVLDSRLLPYRFPRP